MKTHKTFKIMLATIVLLIVASVVTNVDVEAAKKSYPAKTVKVTYGYDKEIKTPRKIKKIKICSKNKSFMANMLYTKKRNKFEVQDTDYGKSQTVKVTYTNGRTQKFKIKTVLPKYMNKVINELKALLSNPDKGLKTVLTKWEKKLGGGKYKYKFWVHNKKMYDANGTSNVETVSRLMMDDIMKTYSKSEKKALILEVYLRARTGYCMTTKNKDEYHAYCANRNSDKYFKKLYNGTFVGVCSDGARLAYDICQILGVKSRTTIVNALNHEWCNVWVKDKKGKSYWRGISTCSLYVLYIYDNDGLPQPNGDAYSFNLKSSVPNKSKLTKKQFLKYLYQPNQQSSLRGSAITPMSELYDKIHSLPAKPTTTPTESPALSAPTITAPIKDADGNTLVIPFTEHNYTCPGCNIPYRHTKANNSYITNGMAKSGNLTVYKHSTSEGIRWFDANGNEYIDVNNNGFITDELDKLQK